MAVWLRRARLLARAYEFLVELAKRLQNRGISRRYELGVFQCGYRARPVAEFV